jgi:hypothetical protein
MYDVYISYSTYDQSWVGGYLLPHLDAMEFQVAIDHRILTFNEPFWVSTERAVANSRHVLAIVSPAWVDEVAMDFERLLKRLQTSEGILSRSSTLLLSPAAIPAWAAALPCFDFTDEQQHREQMRRLLLALNEPAQQPQPGAASGSSPSSSSSSSPSLSSSPAPAQRKTDTLGLLLHKVSRWRGSKG